MWEIRDVSNNVCDGEHQISLEKKDGFLPLKYQHLANILERWYTSDILHTP